MQKEKRKNKRLSVDVPGEFLLEIKKRAIFRGMTIKSWIILAINERIAEERKRE